MSKRFWRGTIGVAVLSGTLFTVGVPSAQAATYCDPNSGTYSGRCWKAGTVTKKTRVVEAVPLVNKSSKTVTAHCAFTQTLSFGVSATVSVDAGVKASLFKVVDLSTSITVSSTVSMTASAATSAAGTITLKPGESVTCQRTFGYVTAPITETYYTSGGAKKYTKTYTATVPSFLGARWVD